MREYKYCNICKEETPHTYNFEIQAWVCYLCDTKVQKKKGNMKKGKKR